MLFIGVISISSGNEITLSILFKLMILYYSDDVIQVNDIILVLEVAQATSGLSLIITHQQYSKSCINT